MSQQQRAELCTTLLCRLVERRESPLVRRVHTCIVLDQQGGNVHVLRGREARDQQPNNYLDFKTALANDKFPTASVNSISQDFEETYPVRSSIMKRDKASFVLGIDISSMLQQILCYLKVVVASCEEMGSRKMYC